MAETGAVDTALGRVDNAKNMFAIKARVRLITVWFLAAFFALIVTLSGHAENPLTNEQLEPLFRAYALKSWSDRVDTNTVFKIQRMEVKGLWEALKVEIFEIQDGYFESVVFAYHDGQIAYLAQSNPGGPGLNSGLVSNGEFYYTYGSGSGIYRSHIAKMQIVDSRLETSISGGFQGKFLFVCRDSAGKIKVVSGVPQSLNFFNNWGVSEDFGFAGMTNASGLQIIDAKGNIIAPTWDPGTNWVIFDKGSSGGK